MEEKKYFMWYDSGRGITYGPHHFHDENLIGKKLYHSLEDLLKTTISDSIKKRLISAKPGTKIKVHYLHRGGDLMLKRIDESQVAIIDQLENNYTQQREINQRYRKLEQEAEEINNLLLPKTVYGDI